MRITKYLLLFFFQMFISAPFCLNMRMDLAMVIGIDIASSRKVEKLPIF